MSVTAVVATAPTTTTMLAPGAELTLDPPGGDGVAANLLFKKHKVLPHPKQQHARYPTYLADGRPPAKRQGFGTGIDTALSRRRKDGLPGPSHLLLSQEDPRKHSGGPEPPPTPPAHSRTSSSSHSVLPSSPTYVETPTPERSTESVPTATATATAATRRRPTTPLNQKSPPTPDVTPPQTQVQPPPLPEQRHARVVRPVITERPPSKGTGTDSRTESFKTARENPYSSDEEERLTARPMLPSEKTSQATVRQVASDKQISKAAPVGLGLGLESAPDDLTPRSRREFHTFDGEWGSASEVEQEWDDNLMRNVTVKKRRDRPLADVVNGVREVNGQRTNEVIEDFYVTPTNATKTVRAFPLHERLVVRPSPKVPVEREKLRQQPSTVTSTGPPASDSSVNAADANRNSAMSTRSTISTVVEAAVVYEPMVPQRRKTLRHVRKQYSLRDSGMELSPPSSAPHSDDAGRRLRSTNRAVDLRAQSYVSSATVTSVASGRARRDVWRNGGIPVVVVPDRRSSTRSSNELSVRSNSSRRSNRTMSLSSVPLSNASKANHSGQSLDGPARRSRSRTRMESNGTLRDQRTMDYPPVVPVRTSSLSAPTSRNGSRAGSLTAESLKAHDALNAHLDRVLPQVKLERDHLNGGLPQVKLEKAPSIESVKEASRDASEAPRLSVDQNGDPFFGQRLSIHKTPFSLASVETTGTSAAEVSEAQAVSIFPHQNKSILMVDHSTKPVHGKDKSPKGKQAEQLRHVTNKPVVKAMAPDSNVPTTPPQPQFSMDDVDSPLRNPRAPPKPPSKPPAPAIALIPATPSGLTPAAEKQKQLGNYFEQEEQRPRRALSLARRAFGRRQTSEDGPPRRTRSLLSRTLSLSRSPHRAHERVAAEEHERRAARPNYPAHDDDPVDESKLHPTWRPSTAGGANDEEDGRAGRDDHGERSARYPPIVNRPAQLKRSFSEKVKRTFAIMPLRDDRDDYYDMEWGPDRRTIRRSPSGSLRVVRHQSSGGGGGEDGILTPARHHSELGAETPTGLRPRTSPGEHDRSRPPVTTRLWPHGRRSLSLSSRGASRGEDGGNMVKRSSSDASTSKRVSRLLSSGVAATGNATRMLEEYGPHTIPRRLSERRREKRSRELRAMISGPREVRDGVGDVIRRAPIRDSFSETPARPQQVGGQRDPSYQF